MDLLLLFYAIGSENPWNVVRFGIDIVGYYLSVYNQHDCGLSSIFAALSLQF